MSLPSEAIFTIKTEREFEEIALQTFEHQYINNPTYQRFCNLMGIPKSSVKKLDDIPYLPIEFFKQYKIISTTDPVEHVFTSSGTTGSTLSKHYITNIGLYTKSFRYGFRYFYGNITNYTVVALLPSYLERKGSSLVFMVSQLIEDSKNKYSGFYLDQLDELRQLLRELTAQKKKVLLIGVTFALLDLIKGGPVPLNPNSIVMETGGMKGRRKEMVREEVHGLLKKGFTIPTIHSEYGMTEVLSQAYSQKKGVFNCPPWMKIRIRDTDDATVLLPSSKTGGINIIDLANKNSCSFIATQDLGKLYRDGSFEVLGRFDQSEIRGCNLMVL